jgi:hypothetical protein
LYPKASGGTLYWQRIKAWFSKQAEEERKDIQKDYILALIAKRKMCDIRYLTRYVNEPPDCIIDLCIELRDAGLIRLSDHPATGGRIFPSYEITTLGRQALRKKPLL